MDCILGDVGEALNTIKLVSRALLFCDTKELYSRCLNFIKVLRLRSKPCAWFWCHSLGCARDAVSPVITSSRKILRRVVSQSFNQHRRYQPH